MNVSHFFYMLSLLNKVCVALNNEKESYTLPDFIAQFNNEVCTELGVGLGVGLVRLPGVGQSQEFYEALSKNYEVLLREKEEEVNDGNYWTRTQLDYAEECLVELKQQMESLSQNSSVVSPGGASFVPFVPFVLSTPSSETSSDSGSEKKPAAIGTDPKFELLAITNEYMTHLEDEIWNYMMSYGLSADVGKANLNRGNLFNPENREKRNNLIKFNRQLASLDDQSASKSISMLSNKYTEITTLKQELENSGTVVLTNERKQILSEHRDSGFARGFAAVFAFLTVVSLPFVWARTGNLFGSLFTSRGEEFCNNMEKILNEHSAPSHCKCFGR